MIRQATWCSILHQLSQIREKQKFGSKSIPGHQQVPGRPQKGESMQVAEDVVWDGLVRGYIPSEALRINPKLQLHSVDGTVEVDPITFEVIRNTLLNINFEHGQTIQKLSISPITMIVRDFQCAILTEVGDVLCLGPYLLYLGNMLGLITKWILENRSGDPGISDGDVFLCNDPYIGTSHQQDTGLTSPVFWKGELFCWVSNSVHYSDVGGPVPGSFCLSSRDIREDPPCFPPV